MVFSCFLSDWPGLNWRSATDELLYLLTFLSWGKIELIPRQPKVVKQKGLRWNISAIAEGLQSQKAISLKTHGATRGLIQ